MSDSLLVAVPSKGRAGKLPTVDFMGDRVTLFVPDVELDAYQRTAACPVVGVPAGVRGITATRNWIIDWCLAKDPVPDLVFIDDDLKIQGYIKLHERNAEHVALTPDEWLEEWARLFDVTRSMGYRLWGVSTDGALRSVYPYFPFRFHSYVTASCCGITADALLGTDTVEGLRFDERFPVKEDYELCLRCIKEDGGVVAARYLYWHNEHWTTPGGCKDYRSGIMEEQCIKRLISLYPGLIRRVTRKGTRYTIQLDFS